MLWRRRCRRCNPNLLPLGPPLAPGSGQSTPARGLTTILPAMTLADAIETTRIHSVAGLTGDRTTLVTTRPVSRPPSHHRRCGADRRGPRAEAGRGVAGPPRRALRE
jgi:predicted ATPase with chaperone activity